eukprot:scaffold576_cov260-Pinguiococcus_pyrenoidosus.AAC.17
MPAGGPRDRDSHQGLMHAVEAIVAVLTRKACAASTRARAAARSLARAALARPCRYDTASARRASSFASSMMTASPELCRAQSRSALGWLPSMAPVSDFKAAGCCHACGGQDAADASRTCYAVAVKAGEALPAVMPAASQASRRS